MDFFRDLLRNLLNPYGNPAQRIGNLLSRHTVDAAMLQAATSVENVRPLKPPKASAADQAIDDIVKNYSLPQTAQALQSVGFNAPKGVDMDEATTRAFIKVGQESGLTLEEIKTLLEHEESRDIKPAPGTGLMQFSLDALSDQAQAIFDRVADKFTAGNLASKFSDIGTEQTKTARKERAIAEYEQQISEQSPSVFQPSESLTRALLSLTKLLQDPPSKPTAFDQFVAEHLGEGYQPQRVNVRNQPNALTSFMDAFADYFGVGAMENTEAEENLAEAIDRLTGAVNSNTDAQTNRNAPQNRIRRFLGRAVRQTGLRAARLMARVARPAMRLAGRIVPRPILQGMQRVGANIVGNQAARLGVPAAAAARFGAALGPAAIAVGGFMLVAGAAGAVVKALKALADSAWKTTLTLTDYSASLAFANARLQMNQEFRKFRAGADVARGAFARGEDRFAAQNRLEEAMRPFETMLTIIGNDIGTGLTNLTAFLFEQFNDTMSIGNKILNVLISMAGPGIPQVWNIWANAANNKQQGQNQFPGPWPADAQLFGPQAPDVLDMARRMAGPRPQVGGGKP